MGKARKSNIELLRILCMLVLIVHHCVLHGKAVEMDPCINREIANFFIPAGKIAFDAFLAISMYFLVDQDFRFTKFCKTWLMVFFYSILFTFVSMGLGLQVEGKTIFASFFPIIGNAHGFAAAYLAFYLLLPFLKKVQVGISQFQNKWLVILLIIFQIGTQMMGSITGYYQNLFSELLLFVLCFFLSGYLKKYPLKICSKKCWLCLIIVAVYALRLSLSYIQTESIIIQKITYFIALNIGDESSIFNLVAGYALFYLFLNIQMPYIKGINMLATGAFPVLLIHDHNVFRYVIWDRVFKVPMWYYSNKFVLHLGFVVVCTYFVGYIIECVRKTIENKLIFNNKKLKSILNKVDLKINGC